MLNISLIISYFTIIQWIPILRKNSPRTHLMLIGTKIDLRNDKVSLLRLDRIQNQKPISVDDGYLYSRNENLIFHECSAVDEVRLEAVVGLIWIMRNFFACRLELTIYFKRLLKFIKTHRNQRNVVVVWLR